MTRVKLVKPRTRGLRIDRCGVGLGPPAERFRSVERCYRQAADECVLDFYDDHPVGSMCGYVDVGAGRPGGAGNF
jgi:hypothetical protein